MTDLEDLPFTNDDGRKPNGAKGRPTCRRHEWSAGDPICVRCGTPLDATASRRGRTNRSRGNAIEREVAKRLGLRRVGQFGGPDDARGDWLAVQVKSGTAFPERIWSWLRAIPTDGAQTAAVVITDAPGPGHRRRAVIVLDLADWIALHGPSGEAA
jgi:hypothetical protein